MTQVNIHTAKTTLSDLVQKAERGEEVIIARRGKPVVRLIPISERPVRKAGRYKGKISCGDEIFEPLSDADLDLWEGK